MSPTPMTPYVVDGEDGKKTPTDHETVMIAVEDEEKTRENDDDEIKEADERNEMINESDKDKICLLNGTVVKNGRSAIYKRVSFGSSKGSMVETMLIERPEDLIASHKTIDASTLKPPSKVRVTFYESQKPHFVTTPESGEISIDFVNGVPGVMSVPATGYPHRASTDSGVDNPFRPGGELSKEADNIVNKIKEGKPIDDVEDPIIPVQANGVVTTAPPSANQKSSINGTNKPGVVEVQHGVVVPPSDGSQVEQIMIKKKPKCQCCVIQ